MSTDTPGLSHTYDLLTTNPYAPPAEASVVVPDGSGAAGKMHQRLFVTFLLNMLFGVFFLVYWLNKRTSQINTRVTASQRISTGFQWFASCMLILPYFASILLETDYLTANLDLAIAGANLVGIVCVIGWIFTLRTLINTAFQSEKGDDNWIGIGWILMFGIFYIQYKLNRMDVSGS